MKEALYHSDQDIKSVKKLEYLFDVKSWIIPYIDTPHNHTNPHNFMFRNNENGEAVMLYRNWSSDTWVTSDGLKLLKV